MHTWTLAGAAVAVGALLPLQALINAHLGRATGGPLLASFLSFLVGTVVLGLALLGLRAPWPTWQVLTAPAPWAWLGGVIGAAFVLSATVLVPRLGAAGMLSLVVLGQVVGSLLLDHHGVLATAARPADALRVAGAVLVLVGAVLVVRPWQAA